MGTLTKTFFKGLMLQEYLEKIYHQHNKGDAREESYYDSLKDFLIDYSAKKRKKKIDITVLPKQTEAGNPDFRIWDGSQSITGYIEAKDTGINLDNVEDSEQLTRYLNIFPNVILTNFIEFRLYRNGKPIKSVKVADSFALKKLDKLVSLNNEEQLFELLEAFFSFSLPKTYTAKSLAVELAKRTRFLKDEIISAELKNDQVSIRGFYNAFKEFLIAGISEDEFADLYSQTITYGLFAARLRAEGEFNRKLAFSFIPKTIGILRDIFRFISIEDIPQPMEVIIDDISEVLAVADAKEILDQYFKEGKGRDPVLYFYETFLEVHDPQTREKRGVYYTPEPVVSFIVRSLHQILKDKFNLSDGLASKNVTLLDPAGGTLSFLAQAIQVAVDEFISKYGKGSVKSFLKEQVLQNYYAFELMMAPYAIGHLKMSFILEELGYTLKDTDRIKYYLTNTLDMKELEEAKFPGMSSLSHESHEAGKVKRQVPILVILGNPPYSGHSSNIGEWISEEIKEYYKVDGKPLGEKNSKWLQDDYVKFIRFAQWKIDRAGEGVIGFITNHSYLDNPTFRGMRQSLMNSFNEIYILDLHGNSLKKEKSPDGSKDENVFDIRAGVAIVFFIKKKKETKHTIYHSEVFGLRENKYDWLNKNSFKSTKWNKLNPSGEFYLFVPQNERLLKAYQSFLKLTDIFPVSTVGLFTARDSLTITIDEMEIWNRVKNFTKLNPELARKTYDLGKDANDWKVELAQKDIIESGIDKKKVTPILYRPFDIRYTYYTGKSNGFHCRPRGEFMPHLLSPNIALCIGRQGGVIGSDTYNIVFLSDKPVDLNLFRRGGELVFPLYLYSNLSKKKQILPQLMMFEPQEVYQARVPNINEEFINGIIKKYSKRPNPEEIFYYIYAVLYSNIYRKKYAEFLKTDFPRIPVTNNYKLFIKLGKLGKEIADLHLLKSKELDKPLTKFHGKGDNKVEKLNVLTVQVEANLKRNPGYYNYVEVYINKEQYFSPVPEGVWDYRIGGYQVCDKWLKDRKGRTLTTDEITTYCRIVTSLFKTIKLQYEIDELYGEVEK